MPRLVNRSAERELFIDNLLVRIHLIIVMIRWTGLMPWGFEFPFPWHGTVAREPLTVSFLAELTEYPRGVG